MKVLIIAHARSGSSNLAKHLAEVLHVVPIGEPFNTCIGDQSIYEYYYGINPDDNGKIGVDCVLKTMPNQLPDTKLNPIEFYKRYVKFFDKVILLKRKNKREVIESYAAAEQTGLWHINWKYTNDIFINEGIKNFIELEISYINKLSKELQLPITHYEDIYSGNKELFNKSMNEIGLLEYADELFPYCDPKNRYRVFENPKKLI